MISFELENQQSYSINNLNSAEFTNTNTNTNTKDTTNLQEELENLFEYMILVETYRDYQYCYENESEYVD